MTRYEILRGLLLRGSLRRQRALERLCAKSELISLTSAIMDTAATIYADLYRRGQLIGDADILIAASALVSGRRLSTDNVAHLARIPDLTVENWFSPRLARIGTRRQLQLAQVDQRVLARIAAHFPVGPQPPADLRPLRSVIDETAVVVAQLHTAYTCRLAVGHPRNG